MPMEEMHLRPMFRTYAVFLGCLMALVLAIAGLASLFAPSFNYAFFAMGSIVAAALFLQILQRYLLHSSTEYVIDGNEITEVKGFWAKDEKHVPIDKIQNYTIDRSTFGKLLGVASVGIQTARAESGYEITLRAIPEKDVESLDEFLDAYVGGGKK